MALSSVLPNRKIVAFMTVGWKHDGQMKRPRTSLPEWRGVCSEPGSRETWNLHHIPGSGPRKEEAELKLYGPFWNDLRNMPWASEFTNYAKVAQNGKIIKWPPEPTGLPPPP